MNAVQVDDRVWLYDSSRSPDPTPREVKVVKVGRTVMTVDYLGSWWRFGIDDGQRRSSSDYSTHYVRTDAQRRDHEARKELCATLGRYGVRIDAGAQRAMSLARLAALARACEVMDRDLPCTCEPGRHPGNGHYKDCEVFL